MSRSVKQDYETIRQQWTKAQEAKQQQADRISPSADQADRDERNDA